MQNQDTYFFAKKMFAFPQTSNKHEDIKRESKFV